MKKFAIYICWTCMIILSLTCRKKTTIKVRVFNAPLNEGVANATVVLVEKKGDSGGGIFGGSAECKEIATAVTDANGECVFDKEKLRSKDKYQYYCAVTESWGIKQGYPCGGKSENYLQKGGTDDWLITDTQNGKVRIQYNNLLQPSQPGDSLNTRMQHIKYLDPYDGVVKGGGGIFFGALYHGDNRYPYPSSLLVPPVDCIGGIFAVRVFKKKMGVITVTTDTIKVYPDVIKTFTINW